MTTVQLMYVFTVFRIGFLHIGHFRTCFEQYSQQIKCPQSRKTTFAFASIHILHVRSSSRSCIVFSKFVLSPVLDSLFDSIRKKTKKFIDFFLTHWLSVCSIRKTADIYWFGLSFFFTLQKMFCEINISIYLKQYNGIISSNISFTLHNYGNIMTSSKQWNNRKHLVFYIEKLEKFLFQISSFLIWGKNKKSSIYRY